MGNIWAEIKKYRESEWQRTLNPTLVISRDEPFCQVELGEKIGEYVVIPRVFGEFRLTLEVGNIDIPIWDIRYPGETSFRERAEGDCGY